MRGGEAVVDEVGEVVLEEADDSESREGRDEGRALLPDVPAVLDGPDDAGVGRRSADAELLEAPDKGRLGVTGRGLGGVVLDLEALAGDVRADGEAGAGGLPGRLAARRGPPRCRPRPPGTRRRKPGFVMTVPVATKRGRGANSRDRQSRGGGRLDPRPGARAGGVVHLRGDRPLPDELVEAALVAPQLAREVGRGAEGVSGGPDRLVGLLGVFHPAAVNAGRSVGSSPLRRGPSPGLWRPSRRCRRASSSRSACR